MELGSLSELLGSSSKSSLFSGTPFQPVKPTPAPIPEAKEEKKAKAAEISKSEESRVVFIGNVPLECKKKHIRRLMSEHGEIVKVWRRSIPLDRGKLPVVAAVALKKYKTSTDTCNFYVLYSTEEEANSSLKANGQEFKGKHLRVDLAYKPERNIESSVFIGNLPFDVKDEELWEEFKEFGDIKYVRVIRNPTTFEGKGIAFVCFNERKPAKRAIAKNNTMFRGRRIRVSKAVEPGTEVKAHQSDGNQAKTHKFYDKKGYKTQSDIMESAPIMKAKHPSAMKGTKKVVRKEQLKLQNKRQQRKENNIKNLNIKKKKKVDKE